MTAAEDRLEKTRTVCGPRQLEPLAGEVDKGHALPANTPQVQFGSIASPRSPSDGVAGGGACVPRVATFPVGPWGTGTRDLGPLLSLMPLTPMRLHPITRMFTLPCWRQAAAACLLASASLAPAWGQTDAYDAVQRLMRANQWNEALAQADQFLASKPRDTQMRFMRGVILTEAGRTTDAIATFDKLTEDFPELPEPYNNLAVLYAGQGQFDKARAALEMAIRTNPSYATAHENLGDVYAKLASQAYSKALQLDARNTAVAPKLQLIRGLFASPSATARPTGTAPVASAMPPQPVPPSPPTPPAASAPSPAPTVPAPPARAAEPVVPDRAAEVESAVKAWAAAWSKKNMNAYLGAYGPGFKPPGGQSRAAWEAERRARILPRKRIEVDITDLSIRMDGPDRAMARFRQDYRSDSLDVNSRKTLEMVRNGNRWLIVRESTG